MSTHFQDPSLLMREQAPKSRVSVDVLIVVHNSAAELSDCLHSIRRHRPASDAIELRVHVYDNASDDGTTDMLSRDFPEVLVYASPSNQGFGAANNDLARASTADLLLLLNPDTIWTCDVVTPLLSALEQHPGAVLAAPKLVYPDGRVQLSSQEFPSLRYELAEAIRGTKLNRVPGFGGCADLVARVRNAQAGKTRVTQEAEFVWATCWLLRSWWVEEHGLFDPRFPVYDEDLHFCLGLRRAGAKALYIPSVELVHIGGASTTPERKRTLMRRARARYYRVNHGLAAEYVYRHVILPLGRLRYKQARGRYLR